METTIKRLGNSKAIILPSYILKIFGLKVSDRLQIKVIGKHILLEPMNQPSYDSLKALFKTYRGKYRPTLEHADNPQGDEVW